MDAPSSITETWVTTPEEEDAVRKHFEKACNDSKKIELTRAMIFGSIIMHYFTYDLPFLIGKFSDDYDTFLESMEVRINSTAIWKVIHYAYLVEEPELILPVVMTISFSKSETAKKTFNPTQFSIYASENWLDKVGEPMGVPIEHGFSVSQSSEAVMNALTAFQRQRVTTKPK